ncbi:class I SAM-dependent methyltransferase [Algoriphagus formosus]|uniref:Methyltransferase domain-containing protein n=1 Tax=Algoriphagus formosus TaxID=2007308 RepID=A0A4R5UVM9_9BACT|nr:methyltransferase domain-containing protein [Algoriphagus aquimaris]TDK43320.1 methyltransferase domain-containing protein [Algoriphagus aquimaris]
MSLFGLIDMAFFHDSIFYNLNSASEVLPRVLQIINCNSILDVGCGLGTWLSVAKNLGISDVLGVDGDYVDRRLLYRYLSNDEFFSHDLSEPLDLRKKFDLGICLEVAEHLPESASDTIVETLIRNTDVILFSAAIPGQGGQNHLNEQWPVYWAEKFSKHGYVFLDIIRPLIWDNPMVDFWYKQNIFIVIKESHELASKFSSSFQSLVHPELYDAKNQIYENRIAYLEKQLNIHPLKRWISQIISKK